MQIKRIAVIGAGIMGHGIAQVASRAGFNVALRDIEEKYLDGAMEKIRYSLSRFLKKGKLTQKDFEATLDRVHTTTDLKLAVADADYIIEAVPEDLELKKELFAKVEALAPQHAIIATNTSQFRISSIASATKRRDKVIGAHFFNPPVIRRFVEIVRGIDTSDETLSLTESLFEMWDMETVTCKKDSAGFITSRLISIWSTEAERIYEEGIASIEDIDKACRLAFGHPMGPLETSDFGGLETGLKVRRSLAEVYGERFRPTQTRLKLVESGYYGRKTGRGFYQYDKNSLK